MTESSRHWRSGAIFFEGGLRTFEYPNDTEKTKKLDATTEGWSTLGDIRLSRSDAISYVTDEGANMSSAGSDTIYARGGNLLRRHQKVDGSVAVFGVQRKIAEEEVKAVVQHGRTSHQAGPLSEAELIRFCARTCPRSSVRGQLISMVRCADGNPTAAYKQACQGSLWMATRKRSAE